MTYSTITLAVKINQIEKTSETSARVSATYTDRLSKFNYPVTLDLWGQAAELVSRLEGQLALVDGTFTLINKVLTVNSNVICPASIDGFSSVNILLRLGKDPELNTEGKAPRVNAFGLVNHRKDDPASGFGITFFGKKAETLKKYVSKGQLFAIKGKLNVYGKDESNLNVGINGQELFLMPKAINNVSNDTPGTPSVTAANPQVSQDWDNVPF